MDELLQALEKKIKQLVDQHNRLKHSNQLLQQHEFIQMHEKETYVLRQQKAIMQIEKLITKLKAIENMT